MKENLADKIIVAFDMNNLNDMTKMAKNLADDATYVKVGMELYLSIGPSIITELKKYNYKIFLDLKLHDIPTTIGKTCYALASLGVDMINIHAAGGAQMMVEAKKMMELGARGKDLPAPKLIAVTHLTSTDQKTLNSEINIAGDLNEAIIHYAKLAKICGLDGVVCSANEVALIKEHCGQDFLTITPGIRPPESENNDQKRVMTPIEAMKIGTDFMVIGRPITQHENPRLAFKQILNSIKLPQN